MIAMHSDIELTINEFPDIENVKQIAFSEEQQTLFSSFNFTYVDVIARHEDTHVLGEMQWCIHPVFEKDPQKAKARRLEMGNARSERIFDPKSYWYKQKLVNNPLLIPVTGTYEHRNILNWTNKVPYTIRTTHQPLQTPFYVPGMYQIHEETDSQGKTRKISTFTMLTTEANEVMYHIHNEGKNAHRMPLYLPLDMAKQWISNNRTDDDVKDILNYKLPADELSYYTVYTLTGKKQRPDGKMKDEPWEWPDLPPLGTDTAPEKQLSLF